MWELARGVARGLSMAGFYGVFGTMFMSVTLLRGRPVALGGLMAAGMGLALFASAAWFALQTQDFADVASWPDEIAALPIVALNTRFAALLLGRCAVLVLAVLLWRLRAARAAALLALCAGGAESWLGHGGAMQGRVGDALLVTSVIHIAAGAVWLGALPALLLALSQLPPAGAQSLARAFSPIGMVCVVLLLITAAVQYGLLIWRPGALLHTHYGQAALVKMLLFAALIAIAVRNRGLTRGLPDGLHRLRAHIGAEIMIGVLLLLAAGAIVQFEPPSMVLMG